MKGMTLTFKTQVATGTDDLNNPTFTTADVDIDDCLIAPITEPSTARESQAMEQMKDQVRIHIPKVSNADISNSTVVYGGKVFRVDSDSVEFMNDNTPGRWNRYFRAEYVGNYVPADDGDIPDFAYISEDATAYYISEDSAYHYVPESV